MLGACTCGAGHSGPACAYHEATEGLAFSATVPVRASPVATGAPEAGGSSGDGRLNAGPAVADVCSRFEQWEEWDARTPFWKHALAGSCAGVMEHLGMYPLDTVKTHMQALRPGGQTGLSDVVRGIAQESGGLGFMRGCTAIASGCIPAHIALFTSYEHAKARLLTEGDEHEPVRAALCGATATACHDLILTPLDLVKQRMQLGCYHGVGDCLRHVLRREGLGGLYRSMPVTLAMNLPFGSALVATNESIKLSFGLGRRDDGRSSLPWYFLAAGLSGALASGATQPFDVVKTRLQTQDCLVHGGDGAFSSGEAGAGPAIARAGVAGEGLAGVVAAQPKYPGFLPAVATIVREEGGLALFHGLLPRMLHAIPAAAMCWGTYEAVKTWLIH